MNIQTGGKVSGVYGIKVLRNAGTDKEHLEDFGESPNMLLDGFFERFSSGDLRPNSWSMYVGSGTAPVEATQTQLDSQVGSYASMSVSSNDNVKVGSDYIVSSTGVASWAIGAIAGNISEVGSRLGSLIGPLVDSRALIVDSLGNPTTITVTSDDKLEISYTLKYIIPIDPHVSQVDFLGVSTTCTLERLGALNVNNNNLFSAFAYSFNNRIQYTSSQGLINDPEQSITLSSTSAVDREYTSPFNGVRRVSYFISTDNGNNAQGLIEYMSFGSNSFVSPFMGLHFSPKIPKDTTKTLTLNFDFTLTRA